MSATTTATTSPTRDEYLFSAACAPDPSQTLVLDPKWNNILLTTPIGRMSFARLAVPAVPKGGKELRYSASLLMAPEYCYQLWQAICMVADKVWPGEMKPNPANPSEMVKMTGSQMLERLTADQGGLINPLQSGDNQYLKNPAQNSHCRGLYVMNAGVAAVNRKTGATQQPITLNENGQVIDPKEFYSGCYGRLQVTVYAYTEPRSGIGIVLKAAQFARHGERLGGFDAVKAATAAFGVLPKAEGTTPNPWTSPTGGAFAAPTGAGFGGKISA